MRSSEEQGEQWESNGGAVGKQRESTGEPVLIPLL